MKFDCLHFFVIYEALFKVWMRKGAPFNSYIGGSIFAQVQIGVLFGTQSYPVVHKIGLLNNWQVVRFDIYERIKWA